MLRYANQKLAAASEVLVKFLALLWSPLRALLRALVGSWQPPGWLRWSLCRLALLQPVQTARCGFHTGFDSCYHWR